ncbi:MAG: hypothetical protein MJ092_08295 [Lachnospiraceae bacterium]|nr:hypothetical protein [Lachnospiraceae bacterium]
MPQTLISIIALILSIATIVITFFQYRAQKNAINVTNKSIVYSDKLKACIFVKALCENCVYNYSLLDTGADMGKEKCLRDLEILLRNPFLNDMQEQITNPETFEKWFLKAQIIDKNIAIINVLWEKDIAGPVDDFLYAYKKTMNQLYEYYVSEFTEVDLRKGYLPITETIKDGDAADNITSAIEDLKKSMNSLSKNGILEKMREGIK